MTQQTYIAQIRILDSRMKAIEEQIRAETDLIDKHKGFGALLLALMSAGVRKDSLQEIYRSRGRIAQLQFEYTEACSKRDTLDGLRLLYPLHDQLIEQEEQLQLAKKRAWLAHEQAKLAGGPVRPGKQRRNRP